VTKIGRRTFLRLTGAGAAAKVGGLGAILASARAPAYAQAAQSVHWLRWADFVPASDVLLKGEITAECQKALGIKLTVETINANDIQARITSSIQSGTGPDIVNVLNNWAHLYTESLSPVDDIAEELGKSQGGFYETARAAAHDGKRWLAVPYNIVGVQIAYRKSWFDEIGYTTFPKTWDEYREAGKKLKAKGRPADAGAHIWRCSELCLSVSVVLRRQGGRGRRQDRGAQQQGDHRVGQIHGWLLEGCARRRRACLG
jgi:multiple sugar transport system substrate-binding protein